MRKWFLNALQDKTLRQHRTGNFLPGAASFYRLLSRYWSMYWSEKKQKFKANFFVVNKKKRTWFQEKSGSFWWRLLDSNQWPPACENASGRQSPAIRCFPALLVPVSADTNHCHVHCVHPLIFWYWSAYWSKPRPRRIRRSRGFFSKTNLVAEIVAWNGTIVKIFF